ncbi:MAG: alpha/beta hydrolase family protein, partial [Paracoccaceae bacterium]|nr:alpha/beta hydrolase family protein [Paracoccaceae bacterium]
EQAARDGTFFDAPAGANADFELSAGWLKFSSDVSTDIKENNVVWAKVADSGSRDHALVVFHHWNANSRQDQIANVFCRRGISVVEMALPYHFERSRPGAAHADYMLSPNLGRTIEAMRQAVLDGRKLIRWLKNEGYKEVSVLGMSLGSWVAGLVAAHEPAVAKASLFLSAGSLADMVWTGRATRLIRASLEPAIALTDLRRAWSPLDLGNHVQSFARPAFHLQLVLATRDTVVLPALSERFIKQLKAAGVQPDVRRLNCGHYSLARPPHILFAGWRLAQFLNR